MELENPITKLDWILGTWKGSLEKDNTKYDSFLRFTPISSEIIEMNQVYTIEESEIFLEKSIFFFDKLHEKLKVLNINQEGYIDISDIIMKDKKNETSIISTFEKGYNLPPNMEIVKEMKIQKKPKSIVFSVKMGKSQATFLTSKYIFEKT